MKSVHICEKCGKQFDDITAAYECETSHLGFSYEFDPELAKYMKWETGGALPKRFVMGSTPVQELRMEASERNSNGDAFAFALYELKRYLDIGEVLQIYEAHDKRVAEERKAFEDYCKRVQERNANEKEEESK